MRSRYTAFALGLVAYLESTHAHATRGQFDRTSAGQWSRDHRWLGLSILEASDTIVEFIAYHAPAVGGDLRAHHERSRFVRERGQWMYLDALETLQPAGSPPPSVLERHEDPQLRAPGPDATDRAPAATVASTNGAAHSALDMQSDPARLVPILRSRPSMSDSPQFDPALGPTFVAQNYLRRPTCEPGRLPKH